MEEKSFTARMAEFFGRKPDQHLQDFAKELKELTQADKVWFASEFNKAEMPTAMPAVK